MNGTIDPIEGFFTSIGSVWGRVLSMFGTCWIAFVIGLLAAQVSWSPGDGFNIYADLKDLALVPIAWMFSFVAGLLKWWGMLFALYLIGIFFVTFYADANLFRMVCLMFTGQALHTWLLAGGDIGDLPYRPVLWLLLAVVALLVWLFIRSWQRDHE
ncbi:hypothetical protein [Roseimicrobium sp. ORNL1]|uniref:hypothetical protein n=1 Tax=Roseimicrobium sp. ORNL1 TaxID=2711231 RepID=UPI0013E0F302|nr:hypothetical protein [Roseimicrobium sp. ORNL1]QIF05032.1 hypothetical protein G5S37_27140 [Roseimicrobium sp. ORNL1]